MSMSHPGPATPQPARWTRRQASAFAALLAFVMAFALAWLPAHPAQAGSITDVIDRAKTLPTTVETLVDAITASDTAGMQQAVTTLKDDVATMQEELSGGIWSFAGAIPVLGSDVQGAKELVNIASDLVDKALVPLTDTLAQHPMNSLMQDGAVDVEAIRQLCAAIMAAQPAISDASDKVNELGDFHFDQLNDAIAKIKDPLAEAVWRLETYRPLIEKIPYILGGNGTRAYLIIAQNNAEIRATGGFPGAWGTLYVDNGQVSLGDITTIAGKRDATFDVTDDEIAVFGDGMAINPANLNMTPDFPRAGQLLAQAWEIYTGEHVDGVIALDPVLLQRMLALTGSSVTADDGTVVDGTNAAQALLSDAYWRFGNDGDAQDAFFANVASLAVDKIMSGLNDVDVKQLYDTLKGGADEGRLIAWLADADEEVGVHAIGLDGALSTDPTKPVLGVYVNDNTWAKICWYLGLDTTIIGKTQNTDGSAVYDVRTTFTNGITQEEADVAPSYVTGISPSKRSVDDMFLNPLLVAPAGGSISDVIVEGTGVGSLGEGTLYGFDIWGGGFNMGAQETLTVTYKVHVPAGAVEELTVRQTPTAQGGTVTMALPDSKASSGADVSSAGDVADAGAVSEKSTSAS